MVSSRLPVIYVTHPCIRAHTINILNYITMHSQHNWPSSECMMISHLNLLGHFVLGEPQRIYSTNDQEFSFYGQQLNSWNIVRSIDTISHGHPKLYTSSVPNCSSFDFFDSKFDHSSYSKKLCKHSQI